jgi:gamma-glutamyltranspeptidase/glutathione hydrolase
MSFGLVGGPMQGQGHLQVALRVMQYRQNPQAAIVAARWRIIGGRRVMVEHTLGRNLIAALCALGHGLFQGRMLRKRIT